MHVGFDYGSGFIKAAQANQAGECSLVQLGPQIYIPNVCCVDDGLEQDNALQLINDLPIGSFEYNTRGFVGFQRDKAVGPSTIVPVGNYKIPSIQVHGWPWQAVKQALTPFVSEIESVIISIPDDWKSCTLALPVALLRLNLAPLAFVPEALAAIVAQYPTVPATNLVCVSMGMGGFRLTHVKPERIHIGISPAEVHQEITGIQIRQAFREYVIEQTTRATRQSVLESRQETLLMDQWIENCFRALRAGQSCSEPLIIFGKPVFSGDFQLDDLFQALPQPIEKACQVFEKAFADLDPASNILVWGDMSFLFPRILEKTNQTHLKWQLGSLDCIAMGCARIARDFSVGERGIFDGDIQLHRTVDGVQTFRSQITPDVIPVIDPLHNPTNELVEAEWLDMYLDGEHPARKHLSRDKPIRIGRDERSEIVLDSNRFPMVSTAHAILTYQQGGFIVRDLGSSNGTFVNDQRVEEHRLQPSDQIRLGANGPQFVYHTLENAQNK